MVGQGVLRECLAASDVSEVSAIVREALPTIPALKLRDVQHRNFLDWSGMEQELTGFDACFFCLGISSVGKTEAEYRHVTYELTLAAAKAVLQASPAAVFVYVSGAGTNMQGRSMWARVKGATEKALLELPFRAVYCFRPGYIQPMYGVRSKVAWYNAIYAGLSWAYPLLERMAPKMVTSTDTIGRAMLKVAREGWPQHILETPAINAAGTEIQVRPPQHA